METEEGNKMIFDFMGCIHSKHGDIDFWEMKNLKYHSSWDWLMPVVGSIQSIYITPSPNYSGYRIEIVVQGYVKIEGFPMPTIMTNVAREGSLINATWQAVVQFLQWYSNNSLK